MIVVQRPNQELVLTLACGAVAGLFGGWLHQIGLAGFFMAGTLWGYGELTAGVNRLRRLMGAGFLIFLVFYLADLIRG